MSISIAGLMRSLKIFTNGHTFWYSLRSRQMKSRRVSRVLGIGSFICALLFAWQMQAPLARADDCGVPDNLFKDGKPPNRLRDPKCKECNETMAQLQAAVDDCYASQLADAEKALNDS